jgi:hypothetical protein
MSEEERRRRLAEFDKEQAALDERRRAARQRDRAVGDTEAAVLGTRSGTGKIWAIVVVVLLLAPLSLLASRTVSRYTGNDFADAKSTFPAVVQSCTKHGPVTLSGGFGTWYSCRLKLNDVDTRTISDPGFFPNDQTGRTITVGDNGTSRGNHHWSRPELPSRGLLDAVVIILGLFAVLVAGLLVLAVVAAVKGRRR